MNEGIRRGLLLSNMNQDFSLGVQAWGWHLLTYEGLFVILSPQAVAARKEGVSISLIKPRQIPEIETQAHLWS